jgi:hypothetical protein
VPSGKVGFVLHSPTSGLSNLILDGGAQAANSAISVGGSAAATTAVQTVTVENFKDAGIVVAAGAVTLGPGLEAKGNGTTATPAPGVWVAGGNAIFTGSAAAGNAGHTSVHDNTQHGVLVTGTGFITIASSVAATAPGVAYVDFDDNHVAGIWISQTPALVTIAQANVVNGVEVTGTVAGNGIHVEGGTFFTLTNSYVVGNHESGVEISPFGGIGAGNSSIANIDLGTIVAPGGNVLQGPINNLTNNVSGVCLRLPPAGGSSGQTLKAAGDVWSASLDCRTDTTGNVTHAATCANGVDIGGIGGATADGGVNGNTANVSVCSLQ